MKSSLSFLILFSVSSMTYDINFGKHSGGQDWYVVNDGVMGGLSTSSIMFTEKSLIFKGSVSLENNGGFASMRSSRKRMDLSGYKTVKLRFRTSTPDRTFAIRLNTNEVYNKPSYNIKFMAKSKDWQIMQFKLDDFDETILGNTTGRKINKEQLKNIIRIGIMLNDKKQGGFQIEFDYIDFN